MPKQIDYNRFFEAVARWQREVMNNLCTVCHGHNIVNECQACGWWGKVAPNDSTIGTAGPKIEDYKK